MMTATPVWPTPTPMPTSSMAAPFDVPWVTNEEMTEQMERAVTVYQMANQQGGIDVFVTAILLVIVGRSLLSLYKRAKSL